MRVATAAQATVSAAELTTVSPPSHDRKQQHSKRQLPRAIGSISLTNKHTQHQHPHQLPFFDCCCCCLCCSAAAVAAAALGYTHHSAGVPHSTAAAAAATAEWCTSRRAIALYKQGGTTTSTTTSPSGTTHPPRHQAGESAYRSSGPPAARWHNPTPLVLVILQLHFSSLCAPSGCRVVYSKQHGAWRYGKCSVF